MYGINQIALCIPENKPIWNVPLEQLNKKLLNNHKLANTEALIAVFICYFEDKTPKNILNISFRKTTFDNNGVGYVDIFNNETKKVFDYLFSDDKNKEIPLLLAPTEPSEDEMNRLKEYVNEHYPHLLKKTPHAIECAIIEARNMHAELIEIMKKYKNGLEN